MVWSAGLAYAIGLITTDGSLSSDGRHINLTSKDIDQLENFKKILRLNNRIGLKSGSYNIKKKYYQVQFGDIKFYKFLLSIGLTPNKSKTLGPLYIPKKYFADFLRGHLDGDGYTYSYWDKRWRSSFMLYTGFISASKSHLKWMQDIIFKLYKINGTLRYAGKSVFHLIYAKKASIYLLKKIYYSRSIPCLLRKRFKIEKALAIIATQADVLELVDSHA